MFIRYFTFLSYTLVSFFVSTVISSEDDGGRLSVDRRGYSTASNSTQEPVITYGWVHSPNGRGTLDIVWACVTTIFLCSWSVLCLNLPAAGDSIWRKLFQKLFIMGLSILGPEFTLMLAIGQWQSAKRSVKDFHDLGYPDWSMTHAFFADMGGFVLDTPDFRRFPLDAKQLHFLVAEHHLLYPATDKGTIKDKNKTDPLVRALTLGQTIWFSISCLSRLPQRLALTTIELTTIGFIICTFATSFCWFYKPSDVEIPIILVMETRIEDVLEKAGRGIPQQYELTPLDFVSHNEWYWSMFWSYELDILRKVFHINLKPRGKPILSAPNDKFRELSRSAMAIEFLFMAIFAVVNGLAWNFWFPSYTEQLLWRIGAIAIPGSFIVFYLWYHFLWTILPSLKVRLHVWRSKRKGSRHQKQNTNNPNTETKLTATSLEQPQYGSGTQNVSRHVACIPFSIIAFFYCLARAYILVEDAVSLRALPSSAYDTVNWTQYIPHLY